MRVAFVGKGGSGKTTVSSLFARHLAAQGRPVVAIDADINQHLGVALGMDDAEAERVPPLGAGIGFLKDVLRGTNPRIGSAGQMVKTTPPGRGSTLLRLDDTGTVLGTFAREVAGVRLLATGPFEDADLGVACYHSKTGAVELLLNHLVDGPGEYVVVDMTAGADAFASGLFTRFDLTVLVVEPTRRSVGVYRQYQHYARDFDVRLAVVGNKVADADDRAFLRAELGEHLLGAIGQSRYVRAAERGLTPPLGDLEAGNRAVLDTVRVALDAVDKDWERYHRQTVAFHLRNARAWGDAATGRDLAAQVDPDFTLAAPAAAAS